MKRPNATAGLHDLAMMETTSRLEALQRADAYGQVIAWHRDHPQAEVSTGQILKMLEQNYLVRVAEMWRIYQAADRAGQGRGAGTSYARQTALASLRLLSDEDTKLTNILKDFGKIIPKSLELRGKPKDMVAELRALRDEMEGDRPAVMPAPPRPRGRPRKLLKAPIPTIQPDQVIQDAVTISSGPLKRQ